MITEEFATILRQHAFELVKIARYCAPQSAGQIERLAIQLLGDVARQESKVGVVLRPRLADGRSIIALPPLWGRGIADE